MRIGVPAEFKNNEYRVGMTPSGAQDLTSDGHTVYIQAGAGDGSGFADEEYAANGAQILATADDVYQQSDMIVKVKEPIDADLARLKDGQLLFTYLHLAPVPDLTASLLKKKITGIAYETITDERKRTLPLLTPMSEVAGRMSVHVGAYYLHKPLGGRGVLLGGAPVGARRRVLPAKAAGRTRRPPRRRAGDAAGRRGHHRRRRGRHQCGEDG